MLAAVGDAGLSIDSSHGGAHGADVVGRGAAASSDDLRAGSDGLTGEAGHVLRRAEIDVAAFDGAGHAGIGHGGDGEIGGGAHGFNRRENSGGSGGAVHADGSGAPLGEERGGLGWRGTVEAVAFVVDGDHDEDGKVRRSFFGGQEGFAGLIESRHGLDKEQFYAGICQGADLFGEGGAGFVEAGLAEGLEADAERADGASDVGGSGLLFFEVIDGLAGEADSSCVDFGDFGGKAVTSEAEAVSAEGVGFDDFRASLEVVLVDGEDQVGVGEVEFVVASVDEDAARVEDRTHGAIGKHRAGGEDIGKLTHSGFNAIAWSLECIGMQVERGGVRAKLRQRYAQSEERVALLYFESQKLCRNSPG